MERKIALLRGINVGGKRKILMADLRRMFEQMNFFNVKTYIQSGNVFFDVEEEMDTNHLAENIEHQIKITFGYDVPVIIRTPNEIQSAINRNPFHVDLKKLNITFLNDIPSASNQQHTENFTFEFDQFKIDGKDVFVYTEGKRHQSKLSNQFFEKNLKIKATNRNWNTVLKLVELSKY